MLSIKGYLERTSLFRLGRLRIRLHRILDVDRTPYLHSHPFSYMSIVLSGGYTEQILERHGILTEQTHGPGSVIFHRNDVPHRIKQIRPGTRTLFFAFYHGTWNLFEHRAIEVEGYHDLPDGIWLHDLRWRKRQNSRWYTAKSSISEARANTTLSIFQNIDPEEVSYGYALDPSK